MRLHRHGTDLALDVRCAFSWHARMRGLLGVSEAALARAGLWLRPCGAVHTLGMVCAIDVVFLDREGVVKKVVASLPPGRWAVARGAHSVLELHAGATLRAGIYPGDRLHVLPR